MKFPKTEVAYKIVFNNTGLDWTDIQEATCNIIESKYRTLHCIGDSFHEEFDVGENYLAIKNIPCLLYFRVKDLHIEVIAIKTENKDRNAKWILSSDSLPQVDTRDLFQVTIIREIDNHKWVQYLIFEGYTEKWFWSKHDDDKVVDEKRFMVVAWQPLPEPYEYGIKTRI